MATVAFACSMCGKQFRVIPEQAGRKVRCPHCETPNSVPPGVFSHQRSPDDRPTDAALPEESRQHPAAAAGPFSEVGNRSISSAGVRTPRQMRFTHSRFAGMAYVASRVLFVIALATLGYTLVFVDWEAIGALPLKAAIPAIALIFVPAGIIATTAFFLMAAAQCTEHLARIAAKGQ